MTELIESEIRSALEDPYSRLHPQMKIWLTEVMAEIDRLRAEVDKMSGLYHSHFPPVDPDYVLPAYEITYTEGSIGEGWDQTVLTVMDKDKKP